MQWITVVAIKFERKVENKYEFKAKCFKKKFKKIKEKKNTKKANKEKKAKEKMGVQAVFSPSHS